MKNIPFGKLKELFSVRRIIIYLIIIIALITAIPSAKVMNVSSDVSKSNTTEAETNTETTEPVTEESTEQETEPPETEPPVTEPPVTEAPATEPPVTEPPDTESPVTAPPATEPPAVEITAPDQTILNGTVTMGEITPSVSDPTAPAPTPDPLPETVPVETIPPAPQKTAPSFFDNCLFIGDSRTVGLEMNGDIGSARVFASIGMTVRRAFQEVLNVEGLGRHDLDAVLMDKQYDKVYLMLGINEIGGTIEKTVQKYGELVNRIRYLQPNAKLYILANLHIVTTRSERDEVYNNTRLNSINAGISTYADNVNIFYLDVNPLFDDNTGGLEKAYTSDDFHLLGKYYTVWLDWIAEHS